MNDTVRIKRPIFCRREQDLGGRISQDANGKPLKVKTRAHDLQDNVERTWRGFGAQWDKASAG